jgi:hypothetical protein
MVGRAYFSKVLCDVVMRDATPAKKSKIWCHGSIC